VTLTIEFRFDEPVTDRAIMNAVFAAAQLFPVGRFTITGIERPRTVRSHTAN